jgi:hypothetical protein
MAQYLVHGVDVGSITRFPPWKPAGQVA